jgi:glycosyltransferase involved in cell wall biosynthesis
MTNNVTTDQQRRVNGSLDEGVRISLVIPAYNEARRLPRTLSRIRDYLQFLELDTNGRALHGVISEIIIVDDGSQDGTLEVVNSWQSVLPIRLISNETNRGKGFSVRRGILEASGDIAVFTDADLSAPIEEMGKLLEALRFADIAIGSRGLDRTTVTTQQSGLRQVAGIAFNMLVRLLVGVAFRDTQCGFKAFVLPRTKKIFEQLQIEGFGFDPEILFLGKRFGFRSVEVSVRWAHDPASKVRLFRDSLKMLADLGRIRWNWMTGRYTNLMAGNLPRS